MRYKQLLRALTCINDFVLQLKAQAAGRKTRPWKNFEMTLLSILLYGTVVCVRNPSNPEPYDTACLNVIKELKESNLFLKQDIQDYDLFTWSCHPASQLRFD